MASASATPAWSVSDLYIGLQDGKVCDLVLGFFGEIANAGDPGPMEAVRCWGGLGPFTVESTEQLLMNSKKSDSSVPGDPLPHLIRNYPRAFALPLSKIYNESNESGQWPTDWKTEHLTIIPNTPNLIDLSQCRNISCTSAFSKILEGQVLLQLHSELHPRNMGESRSGA